MFTVLVISDLSRLSRNQVQLVNLLINLDAPGVQIESVKDEVMHVYADKNNKTNMIDNFINLIK